MVDSRIASGRDRAWKASVVLSEIRSRAELNCACLCFCTLHTNELPRTDPLVQVDYVRVVDLDIGASKSDNLRDQSGHHFGARIHHPLVFIKLEHEPHPRALSGGSTMRSKQSNGGGRVNVRVESSS